MKFADIGQQLRTYRLESGIRAEEIAVRLGVSRDVIRPVPTRHIVKVIRAGTYGRAPDCRPGMPELVAFAARTVCRQEEAGSLEWPQINLRMRTVAFLDTKTGAPRVIRVPTRTAAWLGQMERGRPDQDGRHYVFVDDRGARLANIYSRFAKMRDRAGVPHFRFHDLRHNYAIRRLQSDTAASAGLIKRTDDQPHGIHELSYHLGHSSVTTTEGYLRWTRAVMGLNHSARRKH